jgi:hypothetical protein
MIFLTSALVFAGLGLIPDDRSVIPVNATIAIVPDGGTVLLGGLKAKPAPRPVVPAAIIPDGGTVLLGGLKHLPGPVAEPKVVVPDGGTILLGGLKRQR